MAAAPIKPGTEPINVLPNSIGQNVNDRGVETPFDEREQFCPHPIPRHAQIVVCFVVDKGNRLFTEERLQVRAPAVEQRPNQVCASRVHRTKSSRSRPPKKSEQKRLRLIVAGMAKRDHVSAELDPRPLQKRMPNRSRCVFNGPIFLVSQLPDVRTIND